LRAGGAGRQAEGQFALLPDLLGRTAIVPTLVFIDTSKIL
jgi:hypothetical protein